MKSRLSASHIYKSLFFKAFGVLVCLLILAGPGYSQKPGKEEKKIVKKARKQLANEDYKEAQISYLKLIGLNPKNEIYNFEGGLSYYFADFERTKSVPLFEAALENSKEDTIPELYYYLARAYHLNGQYEKSSDAFNKFKPFIQVNSRAGQELSKQSEYYIGINNNGKHYQETKNDNVLIKNLGEGVNSSYGEYAPVMKKDDNVLLFTSRRKVGNSKRTDKDLLPYEDVFVAQKSGDNWELITDKAAIEKYIPKDLNTKSHDAGIIYSADGNTLYTYKNDLIWKSILENGKWSKLVELDKNINSSQYNIPSVSLSKDGNTIFFVSTRKDGYGGKDIYKSVKDANGKWSIAENLGENINTKFDEDSPYISDDGNTLYFASKGHDGIGGYDIYKSELVDGVYGNPENMGIPVNSPEDDIYLIMDADGKTGFFASAREGGIGGMDIYSFCNNCPTKTTNIINALLADNNDMPVNKGTVTVNNMNNTIGTFTATNGKFVVTTETTGKHQLTVEAPGYEKQTVSIELPNSSSESDLKIILDQFQKDDENYQVIKLTSDALKLNTADTIKLEKAIAANTNDNTNNSNSENNSTDNTSISYTQEFDYNDVEINTNDPQFINLIAKAADKAKNGNKIYIDIKSSASKIPTKSYESNIKLSFARGDKAKEAILNAMIKKGINKNVIIFNKINAIVSGPLFTGDRTNTEKYKHYQYVKISIK